MKIKEHKDGYKEVVMFCGLKDEDYWNGITMEKYIPGYDTEPGDKETISKDYKKTLVVYKINRQGGSRCYEFWSNPYTLDCYVKMFWLSRSVKETKRYKTVNRLRYYFDLLNFPFKKIHNPKEVCHSILWDFK